jgi:hypothetical protein
MLIRVCVMNGVCVCVCLKCSTEESIMESGEKREREEEKRRVLPLTPLSSPHSSLLFRDEKTPCDPPSQRETNPSRWRPPCS